MFLGNLGVFQQTPLAHLLWFDLPSYVLLCELIICLCHVLLK
jgi:hypothetical protein